ncbi:MAG: hypothetical protein WAV48_01680 [Candidatus Magasanikiibacteriota bacterium]
MSEHEDNHMTPEEREHFQTKGDYDRDLTSICKRAREAEMVSQGHYHYVEPPIRAIREGEGDSWASDEVKRLCIIEMSRKQGTKWEAQYHRGDCSHSLSGWFAVEVDKDGKTIGLQPWRPCGRC